MRTENHTYDELDLRVLRALEIDGRASFSRIGAVLGVSDQTVARRFRGLSEDGGVRVVAVTDFEALGRDQWLLRLRCAPDGAEAIAAALARRPDTLWVGLMAGGTEVFTVTRPRSRDDHDELLLGKLPRTPSVLEIRVHQVLHRFYGGPESWLSKRVVLTEAEEEALRPPPRGPGPARIDPEDEPLVALLERDGRATYPELARATGRSESAVKRRLAALLSSGAVYFDIDYPPELVGHGVLAALWITAAPSALHSVGEALAAHPEVAYATATSGVSNLTATAVARDTPGLYAYLSRRLGTLEGVQHVETAPIVRRVKQLTYPKPRF
ncbi:transcriptional regulator, AsnC family [Actinobacteria bacterium OK074]|nr:transcriptional regulator, AsnC family [Actinobacteria bacterium OK074]